MPKSILFVLFISLASLLIAEALSANFTPKAQAILSLLMEDVGARPMWLIVTIFLLITLMPISGLAGCTG